MSRKKLARRANEKPLINEHDLTKNMINALREGILTEDDTDINIDGGDLDLNSDELKAEEDKFREQVTPRVQFGAFKIYPSDQNVEWEGQNLSGLKWRMSVREDLKMGGDYEMDDQVLEEITNLKKYREVWVDEWSIKLAKEYKVPASDAG